MLELACVVVYSNAPHRTSLSPFYGVIARAEALRGRAFVWSPVFLGAGIGAYFSLSVEPSVAMLTFLWCATFLLTLIGWRISGGTGMLVYAIAIVTAGLSLAGTRSIMIAAPVLEYRFYGAVEGRIVMIDRSASEALRLTLDNVRLDGVKPQDTPAFIRISLHGEQGFITPEPGLRIMTTASLSAPSGPVEPGGFDFQRFAWFRQLGAVGYTRVPVLTAAPASEGRSGLFLNRIRSRISLAVRAQIPGEAGAFAAAITTGDRAEIAKDTYAALRGSNLAHLLAISGLHMGLLTGFVFTALRYLLAIFPWVALRYPTKKIAAILALFAGAFYLALSGGNVATQRAFIMVAAMFIAILFDRRALTLRSVAMAAIIVLILRPEALPGPGFQMSFAATTALVAVFGWLRNWQGWQAPKWMRPTLAVVISSAVAGAATAPFAAAHFNQVSHFGLIANLLSVPIMGAIVMPSAVLAGVLAPIGLSWLALAVMRPAIEWILGVAQYVSTMDGAIGHVVTPGPYVLPLIAVGGLCVVLMQGRARLIGLVPIILGFVLWNGAERPGLLISSSGGLIGLLTEEGRVLNKPSGEGFAASNWLENDGDNVLQAEAFERDGFSGGKGLITFSFGGKDVAHLRGRGATGRVEATCEAVDVVILSGVFPENAEKPPGCQVIDRAFLGTTGTLAVFATPDGWQITDTFSAGGRRIWNSGRE